MQVECDLVSNSAKANQAGNPISPRQLRDYRVLMSGNELSQRGVSDLDTTQPRMGRLVARQHVLRTVEPPNFLRVQRSKGNAFNVTMDGKRVFADWMEKFRERILELRKISEEDHLDFDKMSLLFAERFIINHPGLTLPSVALLGNGNIRLVWQKGEEQIGMQFLKNGRVQYVLFQQDGGIVSPVMGTRARTQIMAFISRLGMQTVMSI